VISRQLSGKTCRQMGLMLNEASYMGKTFTDREEKTPGISWLVPLAIAAVFLIWGLAIFFLVGDKGPPAWDFGVVEDIPGQSPYSTERR
jgi:hypothetical protein